MSVNMNTLNAYNAYTNNYNKTSVKEKKETEAAKKTDNNYTTGGQKRLSVAAQELLEKLKSTYSDMDFMVADYENDDEAREILSRGTKEFSVLFSTEELEKMAVDDTYYEEKIAEMEKAVQMSEEINAQLGNGEDSDNVELTKIGISFNSDGTTSYFAELEKVSEKQKERIEKAQEKKAEEKKAEEKKENSTKRVVISADSKEELLEKIAQIDWSKVKEDSRVEGIKFDYSV